MLKEAFGEFCDRRKWTAIVSAGRFRLGSILPILFATAQV
jgi:hypothetical protein